jgi:cGMP-dependent protein kinase
METQKNNRSNLHEISKNIKLEEMLVLKKLGEGQFGNVFLVTDKNKENCYALKCISK